MAQSEARLVMLESELKACQDHRRRMIEEVKCSDGTVTTQYMNLYFRRKSLLLFVTIFVPLES